MYLKLTKKAPERRLLISFYLFIINSEHSEILFLSFADF